MYDLTLSSKLQTTMYGNFWYIYEYKTYSAHSICHKLVSEGRYSGLSMYWFTSISLFLPNTEL